MSIQTASEGLKALPNLVAEVHERAKEIEKACVKAQENWIGLGRVGGQRQDSAAEFLKSVRREVADMAKFLERVDDQMIDVIADPWGDGRFKVVVVPGEPLVAVTAEGNLVPVEC